MADLSISSSGGSQTTTQNPQGLVSSGTASTEAASNVQSGTATALLTTPTGIALHPSQLPTIAVNTSSEPSLPTSSASVATAPPKHHVSSALLGISAGLFIIAIIIFWAITRSAKNTTNYK
jgi:hypothetical protein